MCKKCSGDSPIYTLAENGTNIARQNTIIVNGEGSDLSKKEALKGRAKRKTITQSMMLKLIDIANQNGEEHRTKAYWNTYYCQQRLVTADGKLYGKYCKNRFCTLCCSIRKAEIINKYYPIMKEWEAPYFLTLTVKSCNASNLPRYIKKMNEGLKRITAKHRKRYQRGRGKLLIGVRSLECNFNTLAENGTNIARQNTIIVNGEGSDLSKKEALKGRAKRKTITQSMMLKLIDIANQNGEEHRTKAYWNTYYCQQRLVTADGKLYGKYCKNRFCTLCCSIRKAEIINKYYPIMKEWEAPYFLTLTVKSCNASNLPRYIKKMNEGLKRITAKHRKRYQRGRGKLLIGVRSLECNFNPIKKTYNPHFHIITKDKETAEIIRSEWLKLWTPKYAQKQCQDLRKVYNLESGLIEIIKYGSKIFTEPDLKKRAKETSTAQIYIKALDTILSAMKGKRIFDRFGFNCPKESKKKRANTKLLSNFKEWEFDPSCADWTNTKLGEILAGYELPSQLSAMLECNFDTVLK